MNKLLPQFQNVTLWQSFLLAVFSILLTWGFTIYAVNDYIQKTSNENSKSGSLTEIAVATFDAKVMVFGLGAYLVAGIACFILLSLQKRFRVAPTVQCIWGLFILFGVIAAYVFR
jgi:hypothetical protein